MSGRGSSVESRVEVTRRFWRGRDVDQSMYSAGVVCVGWMSRPGQCQSALRKDLLWYLILIVGTSLKVNF